MSNTAGREESEVVRSRRVRDELDRQFKSADEALAYLSELERRQKLAVARSSRAKRKRARSSTATKSTIHS